MSKRRQYNYRGLPCIKCGKPVDHDWSSHRRCRACNSAAVCEHYDPKKARENSARLKYGVDLAKLLKDFPHCGICGVNLKFTRGSKGFAIDHDHKTGRVRGLLCNACNRGMGLLQDSPRMLRAAAQWLETAN